MRKPAILIIMCALAVNGLAQEQETKTNTQQNIADKLLSSEGSLNIGGYAQIDYNQPLGGDTYNNGNLDIHRLVLLFGYRFNDKASFVTEIEYEHVKEVFVEQAFLDYKLNNSMSLRGGLLLIPMGIINEYHEPPTFNGVERPLVDSYIAPTTWRELGFGVTGTIISASMKYQAYVVNGFNGYDGDPHLSGKNGLRKGRQKGAESFMSSPNATFKLEYYGIRSLNIGLSGYFGKTQSSMFDGLSKNDNAAMMSADSSAVGIRMIGIDARYNLRGLQLRGQYYFTKLSNTDQYNVFTSDNGQPNDLGSALSGWYIEAGYDILSGAREIHDQLIPFVRYEMADTHFQVEGATTTNDDYSSRVITAGLGWKISSGSVVKADIQFRKTASGTSSTTFNTGIGIMF